APSGSPSRQPLPTGVLATLVPDRPDRPEWSVVSPISIPRTSLRSVRGVAQSRPRRPRPSGLGRATGGAAGLLTVVGQGSDVRASTVRSGAKPLVLVEAEPVPGIVAKQGLDAVRPLGRILQEG